ncbi:hypothetical protein [Erythrobacter colymbi]|uniref:hypothetical protein n=1 Tax=Erythrobacter colymbi TaxID=1161202 RepID=UPI001F0ABD37|nr:hypothetical protein [Erythrobacter colymbi]
MTTGELQPRSPFYVPPTSSGQYSLTNAARTWTKLWLVLMALGWTAAMAARSSPPVRVSFNGGSGSFLGELTSNPRFFEHVMGWPIGWTAPGEPVTGFAAWLQRSRIALSQLTSPGTAGGPGGAHEA